MTSGAPSKAEPGTEDPGKPWAGTQGANELCKRSIEMEGVSKRVSLYCLCSLCLLRWGRLHSRIMYRTGGRRGSLRVWKGARLMSFQMFVAHQLRDLRIGPFPRLGTFHYSCLTFEYRGHSYFLLKKKKCTLGEGKY